jgi:nitrate reductase NapAB chaperone NapD
MLDAYNISFMLMEAWRKYAMQVSGACEKLGQVPVYVDVDGKLVKVIDVTSDDGKIILKTEHE